MILRVERDGVEFFVDTKTGDTGISISGLARLCGVSQVAITRLLQRLESLVRKTPSKTPEDHPSIAKPLVRKNGEPVITKTSSKTPKGNPHIAKPVITKTSLASSEEKSKGGRPSHTEEDLPASILELLEEENLYLTVGAEYKNAKVVREAAIAKLVEYYALDTKSPTATAQNALRQFNRRGVKNWIYDIVEWQPVPKPPTVALTRAEQLGITPRYIDGRFDRHLFYNVMIDKRITAAMYRVYFYFLDCNLTNHRPTPEQVSQVALVAKHNLYDLIQQMRPLSLVPEWFDIDESRRPIEARIRDRLHQELGGQVEAPTMYGPIDLLTPTELIEIKNINDWTVGLGQILAKSPSYPKHARRLHLFGTNKRNLRNIKADLTKLTIAVTYESSTHLATT
jgi:hypothetical protein